jgi:hypothetical protein
VFEVVPSGSKWFQVYCVEAFLNMQPISIDTITERFTAYPADVTEFAADNDLTLPQITSLKGQGLALLTIPENRGVRYADRQICVEFFNKIGMDTDDAIQHFNKATGIKRLSCQGKYIVKFPFVADTIDLSKRRGLKINKAEKSSFISMVKSFSQRNIIDVPEEKWQKGHLDPTIPDGSENNVVWQPPIQGKYRDRFKFGKVFGEFMWPTGKELCSKFSKYYTTDERYVIWKKLNKEFKQAA